MFNKDEFDHTLYTGIYFFGKTYTFSVQKMLYSVSDQRLPDPRRIISAPDSTLPKIPDPDLQTPLFYFVYLAYWAHYRSVFTDMYSLLSHCYRQPPWVRQQIIISQLLEKMLFRCKFWYLQYLYLKWTAKKRILPWFFSSVPLARNSFAVVCLNFVYVCDLVQHSVQNTTPAKIIVCYPLRLKLNIRIHHKLVGS